MRRNNHLRRKAIDQGFKTLFLVSTLASVFVLSILLFNVFSDGLKYVSIDFLTRFPSRFPEKSGIKAAIVGTTWIVSLTALISIPIGVGTAIYLEEFATKSRLSSTINLVISNLAGIPSVVYGIFGLAFFVRFVGLGRSILAGSLTLSLLILPIIIVSSQESLKTVPKTLKNGSYALGASHWQTVTKVILPYSLPNVLTGIIFAISRAIGETASLLMVGAFSYVSFLPRGINDSFITLPIQIYTWSSKPGEEFLGVASAAIIVLISVLLISNSVAIFIRSKYQQRYE
ncbi:phosphate ABC transporter permease PstA [Haloplasma contractile]|uniref:Phosphate transport system permease protein PstA n=1 Tax=Haloplasma contractile SSD-17B TaxID=1033810 RepID=F7PWM2_9MOLU|nr:phosphate ABC transporter permease PstA [Haloplasma contractile]ERJ12607.1 Phosphate ABC transporter inner membrane subunit PstA protein [Haloplasma contractile SSD-17B]